MGAGSGAGAVARAVTVGCAAVGTASWSAAGVPGLGPIPAPAPAPVGFGARRAVTASRRGGFGHGRMAAATSLASLDDRPKNLGSTSASFTSVRTRESSPTADKQSRPSRSAASTAGWRGRSRAAVSLR